MKYKSIKKSLKKRKYSVLSVFLLGIIILMMFSSTKNVIASDNYSNYLYNQELNVHNDRAMILNEKSDNSNNYRNFFDSGFVFPAKLSNQMFNAFTTDYTQYSLSQIYLDNLDNDLVFKSNDNSENIITQNDINISQNDIINGTYKGIEYIDSYKNHLLKLDSDIQQEWNQGSPPIHYTLLQQGAGEVITLDNGDVDIFSFENPLTDDFFPSTLLNLSILSSIAEGVSFIRLYNDIDFDETEVIPLGTPILTTYNYEISLSRNSLENMKVSIESAGLITTFAQVNYIFLYYSNSKSFNTSIIKSDDLGLEGLYSAEYSFTDDIDDTIPNNWNDDNDASTSVLVKSEIDGHKKVIYIDDNSASGLASIYNTFPDKTIETFELWFRTKDKSISTPYFHLKDGATLCITIGQNGGNLARYRGGWINIIPINDNIWYHLRIDFDTTLDTFDLYLDLSIELNNEVFRSNGVGIDQFDIETSISVQPELYIDAIDYSWSDDYYLNRNYESGFSQIKIVSETSIEYLTDNSYTPVFLTFYSELCLNISGIITFSFFNYDLDIYSHNFEIDDINVFNLNSFTFNESGYYRLNKFKIKIESNSSYSMNLYINSLYLNITYIKINENGFHELSIKFDKQKDDTTHIGYSLFEIKIYDNFFLYRYSEINELTDNYITNWFNLSYDSIETFEVNIHVRYGLNTLDIEITNILVDIYIDSINVLTFLEQDRKYFLGKHYKSEFNYTCNNRNYLNLTGIIGNYSYNTLKGIRTLSGENDIIYNRFFNVPLFQENIDVSQRIVSQGTVLIENEPEPPKDAYYWSYQTFRLIPISSTYTEVGNWSIEYKPLEVQTYQAKYYYNPESISERKLGNWKFKIGSVKVNFNFIRNTVCKITNLILLFFQYLMYLVVASLSFIFMFLGCYIIAFLYNICLYYIYIGLLFVLWYLWVLLLWLWTIIIWIWSNIIIPFASWFWNVIVPIIMDWIIKIIAFFLTILIFVLTLGQIDFDETYLFIYDTLWLIVRELYEWFMVFMENILYILMFIMLYLICLMYLYFRYLMARARGFDKKAQKYYYTLTFFFTPFMLIFNWVKQLLDITPVA